MLDFLTSYWHQRGEHIVDSTWRVIVSLAVLAIAFLVIRRIIDRVVHPLASRVGAQAGPRRAQQAETLRSLLRSIAGYAIVIIAIVTILANVGVDIKTIIAGLGVVGLAVGFGAQQLVRDIIAGFFILAEDQYAVGDYVTISGFAGYVEEVGMRFTRLRDDEGKQIWVSNGSVSTVVNHSRGPIEIRLRFSVSAGEGVDALVEKMKGISKDLPREAQFDGIAEVVGSNVVVEFRARAPWAEREAVADRLRQEIVGRIQAAGLTLA